MEPPAAPSGPPAAAAAGPASQVPIALVLAFALVFVTRAGLAIGYSTARPSADDNIIPYLVRLRMLGTGLHFAFVALLVAGALDLSRRTAGTALIGARIVTLAAIAIAVAAVMTLYADYARIGVDNEADVRALADIGRWAGSSRSFAWLGLCAGLIVAGWSARWVRYLAAPLVAATLIAAPLPFYELQLARALGPSVAIRIVLGAALCGLAIAVTWIGRPPVDSGRGYQRGASALTRASGALYARLWIAVSGGLLLVMLFMTRGRGAEGLAKLWSVGVPLANAIAGAVLVSGILGAAGVSAPRAPRIRLSIAGAAMMMSVAIGSIQIMFLLRVALGKVDHGSLGTEGRAALEAYPILIPALAMGALAALGWGLHGIASMLDSDQLMARAASSIPVVLTCQLVAIAIPHYIAGAEGMSVAAAMLAMMAALAAAVISLVSLARLCNLLATGLRARHDLPQRVRATGPTMIEHDDPQPYPVLPSHVDRKSADYAANREANLAAVDKLAAAMREATVGGGEKYTARHKAAGKLLPRERIELLLDRDSYFLELCPLAGKDVAGHAVGASVVGGIGRVAGVECVINATEATVKGGAMSEVSVWKSGRLSDVALHNRLPSISMIESAGADLPNQHKIFVPGGRGFRDLTQRSEARIPTICLVFGSSTAGGAYIPGMSDYVVMVKQQAQVYLAGPPLVKMATGEDTSHEELGGAEMHAKLSGVADYLAEDERDAIRLGREIVAHLGWTKGGVLRPRPIEPPHHDPDDLLGVVSSDLKVAYDSREVIARIVDGSRFSEFKPRFGSTLICGWAHLAGFPVGILANNGILFSESAQKGAQFIELCNQVDVPLVFLQNITGFMVGKKYEQEGIIKHGAKLINAVSNSTVPAITIMTGASYGAGNYAMCGRAYAPRFLFTWPTHRIAVMGGKQLAGVMDIIQRDAAGKRGEPVDEQKLAVGRAMIEAQIDKESDPYFATARLWDDGIIDPRDTRTVIAIALSAAYSAPVHGTTSWGVFRH